MGRIEIFVNESSPNLFNKCPTSPNQTQTQFVEHRADLRLITDYGIATVKSNPKSWGKLEKFRRADINLTNFSLVFQLVMFSMELVHRNPYITAAGFFNIDFTLMYSVRPELNYDEQLHFLIFRYLLFR